MPNQSSSTTDLVADEYQHEPMKMPRKELTLLVFIILYVIVTFLPWTHDRYIAGVGLIAWMMMFLMFAAPLAGLVMNIFEKSDDS